MIEGKYVCISRYNIFYSLMHWQYFIVNKNILKSELSSYCMFSSWIAPVASVSEHILYVCLRVEYKRDGIFLELGKIVVAL